MWRLINITPPRIEHTFYGDQRVNVRLMQHESVKVSVF